MTTDNFVARHNGPRDHEIDEMLKEIGVSTLDELINQTVPQNIRLRKPLNLPNPVSEYEFLGRMKKIAAKNKLYKSYIGMG